LRTARGWSSIRAMRSCAKNNCDDVASVTMGLRYEDREVLLADLLGEEDPNLLDLCARHADRLTLPIGWRIRDERSAVAFTWAGRAESSP